VKEENLMSANELLIDIDFENVTKKGPVSVLKKLDELGIQVKGQRRQGPGISLLISRAQGEALKQKIMQKNAEKSRKENPAKKDAYDLRLKNIESLVQITNNALFSIANDLGLHLCDCGIKNDSKESCQCGAIAERDLKQWPN